MNSGKKLDKTYGIVFKSLRTSKKFSKDEAAGNIISTKALSNFENGESMTAFDKVFEMLKNINVTLLEFDDAFNLSKQKQDILLYDTAISIAFLNHNTEKLKFMLLEVESEIKHSKNAKKYKIDKWKIEAVLERLDPNYTMPSTDIFLLKNYLMALKDWGLYDIHLFGYCINILTSDNDVEKLTSQMLLHTDETRNLHNIEHAVIQTLLNVIDFFLSKKNFKLAKKHIDQLKRFKIHDYYMFEKLTLKYSEASLEYQQGKNSALEIMKKCKEVALFCDCPALANVMSQEISEIQKKI